jgi:hypothetical protein
MSKFLTLGMRDFVRALVVTVGTAFLTALVTFFNAGKIPSLDDLRLCGAAALAAGVTYITKNLFTNSKDQLGKKE